MTEKLELYRCEVCGNIVEVVISGVGELVCCGKPMKKLTPKNDEVEQDMMEKHKPTINRTDEGFEVIVGSNTHPMELEHYIQFIEVHSEDSKCIKRVYFEPHEVPILESKCKCATPHARAYCNIHGLYRS